MAGQRATAGHGMPGKMNPSIGSGSCAGFLLGRSPLQCQRTAGVCPGMVTGPCCCRGWWLLQVPARHQLLELPAGMVAGPWSVLPRPARGLVGDLQNPACPNVSLLSLASRQECFPLRGRAVIALAACPHPALHPHSILPARLTACLGQRKLSQEEEGAVSSEDLECFSHLIW